MKYYCAAGQGVFHRALLPAGEKILSLCLRASSAAGGEKNYIFFNTVKDC
jgi:hypothetical protein